MGDPTRADRVASLETENERLTGLLAHAEDELRKYASGVPLVTLRHKIRDALAAAQEPPADRADLPTIEEIEGILCQPECSHLFAVPHGEKLICTTCGWEVRFYEGKYVTEPPAEGGDR